MNEENKHLISGNNSWSFKGWCQRIVGNLKPLCGMLTVFLATVCGAGALAFLQSITKTPPVFQINATSNAIAFVGTLVIVTATRELPRIKLENKWSLLAVCVFMALDDISVYNSESIKLPLGSTMAIVSSSNIVFSVMVTRVFLQEKLFCVKACAVLIALLGLTLNILSSALAISSRSGSDSDSLHHQNITNPHPNTFLNTTSPNSEDDNRNRKPSDDSWEAIYWNFLLPVLILVTGSLFNVICITVNYASGLNAENVAHVLFWVSLFGSAVSCVLHFAFEHTMIPDPLEDKLYLVGNGVFVSLQTLGYVVGARLISPTMFSVVETVGIPVYFFTQEIFLHQVALPYNLPLQITSLVVVFIASITLPLYETVNNKNPEEKTEKQ